MSTARQRHRRLDTDYERIMVSTILKRAVALTACGFSAGSRTTSPARNAMGLPATVTSASPSMACTKASNGEVCSLSPLSFVECKDRDVPFISLQDDSAYDRSLLIVNQAQQGKSLRFGNFPNVLSLLNSSCASSILLSSDCCRACRRINGPLLDRAHRTGGETLPVSNLHLGSPGIVPAANVRRNRIRLNRSPRALAILVDRCDVAQNRIHHPPRRLDGVFTIEKASRLRAWHRPAGVHRASSHRLGFARVPRARSPLRPFPRRPL